VTTNEFGKSTPEIPDHTPFTTEVQGGVEGIAYTVKFRVLFGMSVNRQFDSQREAERRAEFLTRSGRKRVRVQKRMTMMGPDKVGFYGSVSGEWQPLD
jgi:hypothetical protein